jgi:hypothetical protein
MKPVILNFDCIDHDPIEEWVPENPKNVDFWMNFTIGPDSRAGDYFQVHVLTEENFKATKEKRHAIVIKEYSLDNLLIEIDKILEKCHGSDWEEMSLKLSQYMGWEFENYQPYSP